MRCDSLKRNDGWGGGQRRPHERRDGGRRELSRGKSFSGSGNGKCKGPEAGRAQRSQVRLEQNEQEAEEGRARSCGHSRLWQGVWILF